MNFRNKNTSHFKSKLRILISVSFLILSIILLSSIFIIIYKIGKPLLISENNQLQEQYGNKIIARLGQEALMTETLTASIANLAESLDYKTSTYKKIIPHLINPKGNNALIAGGGIWPEPYVFTPEIERRSFFWGKDSTNRLTYYDNYNYPTGSGYHHEEWYVPSKYIKTNMKFWSKSYMDPYSLEPMVTCTVPIYKDDIFQGVATIDIRLKGLNAYLQNALKKSGGYAYAFDRNNKLLNFPDEKFAKTITQDDSGKIIQEYLNVDQLAQKDSLFTPIAEYLKKVNKNVISLSRKDPRFNPDIAKMIATESYQINQEEADLITAVMYDPLKDQTKLTNKLNTFYIKNDIILKEPVIVSIFHMPRTYWKIVIVTPYQKSFAIINYITRKLLLFFSIILLISLLITYIMLRTNILIPLQKLSLQLKKVQTTPIEKAFFLEFNAKNEIGELVFWLNQRTKDLQLSTRELIKAKEQAEESDRLKTAFLQNISHEIRTPLNAISGFSDLLCENYLSEEDRSFYSKIIQNNSQQLISIVTDVLTISSIETKQEKINISKVNINNIITELHTIFKTPAQSKNILLQINLSLKDEDAELLTDKTKVTQILTNLLSNALKFTNKGSIEFGYYLKNNEIEFYVRDSGLGIPQEFQKTIFKRFGQVLHDGTKLYSGTGLGLSISKGFVKLLGGKIWLESTPETGSIFFFTIPYNKKSL